MNSLSGWKKPCTPANDKEEGLTLITRIDVNKRNIKTGGYSQGGARHGPRAT